MFPVFVRYLHKKSKPFLNGQPHITDGAAALTCEVFVFNVRITIAEGF
jgi:hypothetical protein